MTAPRGPDPGAKGWPARIDGAGLVLEQLRPAHLAFTGNWLADPDLRRALVVDGYPFAPDRQRRWYQRYRRDPERVIYMAVARDGGAPIGQIGFNRIDRRHRRGELHLFLGEPRHRGQGHGRQMLALLLDLSFGAMGLEKVWLLVNADNSAAIAFYRAMGFVQEGLLRRHDYHEGEFLDKIIFSRFAPR
jgi:RimJ/RimL family protein N-acetyltransferase